MCFPRTPKERVQKVAEVYVHLEDDARVLVCRRRVFANRVVRLWVQDEPERLGIQICARDEAFGGSGQLFISDENLRHAYRHFSRGRLGGFGADMAGQSCSVQAYPPICMTPLMEVALTEELVASLLDAVCFEVNSFGDEWFIYLPGFGKARAEVPQGPAMRVASQSSGIPRRRPQSAEAGRNRGLGGRFQRRWSDSGQWAQTPLGSRLRSSTNSAYQCAGPMTGQFGDPSRPLGNRLRSMTGSTLPGEPLTVYDDKPSEPSHASPERDPEWRPESWQTPRSRPSRPSSARPSSAGTAGRPWIPPGVPKCLEPAPLLSEPAPKSQKRSPRRARSRQSSSQFRHGSWSGQGALESRWTEGIADDFSRGVTPEETTFYKRAW